MVACLRPSVSYSHDSSGCRSPSISMEGAPRELDERTMGFHLVGLETAYPSPLGFCGGTKIILSTEYCTSRASLAEITLLWGVPCWFRHLPGIPTCHYCTDALHRVPYRRILHPLIFIEFLSESHRQVKSKLNSSSLVCIRRRKKHSTTFKLSLISAPPACPAIQFPRDILPGSRIKI